MIKVLVFLAVTFTSQSVFAAVLSEAKGEIILTVTGNISHTNGASNAQFDLAMLQAMPQTTIKTETPWTEGIHEFTGPKIQDLLQLLAADGNYIEATALNGYKVTIPMQDVIRHSIILALKHNGKILSVRRRGPSWVIYPWSDMELSRDHKYYTRSIWQVKSLNIL